MGRGRGQWQLRSRSGAGRGGQSPRRLPHPGCPAELGAESRRTQANKFCRWSFHPEPRPAPRLCLRGCTSPAPAAPGQRPRPLPRRIPGLPLPRPSNFAFQLAVSRCVSRHLISPAKRVHLHFADHIPEGGRGRRTQPGGSNLCSDAAHSHLKCRGTGSPSRCAEAGVPRQVQGPHPKYPAKTTETRWGSGFFFSSHYTGALSKRRHLNGKAT